MKKLNLEQIKPLVHGAANVEEKDGKISLFRFTNEQRALYKTVSEDFYMKSFATAGITLEFDTDSENLVLSVTVSRGSSRRFFTHSIFVNGKRIGELSGDIGEAENVRFGKIFNLGFGMKRVKILFPWSVASSILSLELDDNAKVIPIVKKCKMLMFGDSITQGYDAMLPEDAYAVRLSELLNAQARNKAIGGERFFAKLALEKENFEPDIITVAYGTNDWSYSRRQEFETECSVFFTNLRKSYPSAKIIAITPVWRVNIDEIKEFGAPLRAIGEYIKKVSDNIPNMCVLEGIDLIPHDPQYYSPDGVHPNDTGFEHYSNSLLDKIREIKGVI